MPNKDFILFLDLETTGSSLDEGDEIIEVGLVLLNSKTLDEVDTFQSIVFASEFAFNRMLSAPKVKEMHEANGLLDAAGMAMDILHGPDTIDLEISGWIEKHVKGNDHIPYGGSGVAHFDRKFIDKFLPRLSKRITYWALDVGSVRRIHDLATGESEWPSLDGKTHRALDDARHHAEELRYAVRIFQAEKDFRKWLKGEYEL